jgi:hypothetical protein
MKPKPLFTYPFCHPDLSDTATDITSRALWESCAPSMGSSCPSTCKFNNMANDIPSHDYCLVSYMNPDLDDITG